MKRFVSWGKNKNLPVVILLLGLFIFMSSIPAPSPAYGMEVIDEGEGAYAPDEYFTLDKMVSPVAGQCNVFDVELKIHVEQELSTTPCDVILVMDCSGSMDEGEEPWPIQYAQEAAIDFAGDILAANSNSRVAVVSYESKASLKQGLSGDFNKIEDAINSLRADGRTNIEKAFILAREEIRDHAAADSNKAIVLLSDGVANQSVRHKCSIWPTASTACTDAAIDAGIEARELASVYTVGLLGGIESQYPECVDIARDTLQSAQNSGYYETFSAPDLAGIYNDIAGQIIYEIDRAEVRDMLSSHFELIEGSISDGGEADDHSISWSIDTGSASADISLSYQVRWIGHEPCGIYNVNDEAYLEYFNSEMDDVVRVDFPLDKDGVQVRCIKADINIESLADDKTWSLEAVASGGTPPYSFVWTDNGTGGNFEDASANRTMWTKPAGFYGTVFFDLKVLDINNCVAADSIKLTILRADPPSSGGGGADEPVIIPEEPEPVDPVIPEEPVSVEPIIIPEEPEALEPIIVPEEPEPTGLPEPEPLLPDPALPRTGADYIIYNAAGLAMIAAGIFMRRRK